MTATTLIFFFLMLLTPCLLAVLVGVNGHRQESEDPALPVVVVPEPVEAPVQAEVQSMTVRELTRAEQLAAMVGKAEEEAIEAHAAAARAHAAALIAAARAASARAEVAAEAAEAAALVAEEAHRVVEAARAAQLRATTPAPRDLPANHPSLDFPRSHVIRRAA